MQRGRKRVSNDTHVTQTPMDDNTPPTTLFSGIDEVMHGPSEGIPIQPRTLLPQFHDVMPDIEELAESRVRTPTLLPVIDEVMCSNSIAYANSSICDIINQPSTRDGNIEEDPYDFVYNGIRRENRVLKERSPCPQCGAKRFKFEFPTFCCMSGKTVLANSEIPGELYRLFTSQDEIGKMFREHICAYNTNFSFTSMGVTLDDTTTHMRSSVYTFRAHKGIYHKIDQLVSSDGKARYLQLYFYDPDTNTFLRLAELGPLENYRVTLNALVELDQRVYNRPTTSEVAGIWVEGNDNITLYKRSIVVYGRSEYSQYIQSYFGCYDPCLILYFFLMVSRVGILIYHAAEYY
ncbi:hypothetical protein SSX86_001938 [Deinandra increscens subsp. villosa]|uniref:Helitron helicase-like domain-containing protein n=1 Tax=Deinandra increscens subsp. villosa TaxID=3103831 RepID=A0AAP0HD55_9ASTR